MPKQEQQFGYRIKTMLERYGFNVILMPMALYRTQLIDAYAIKNNLVLPIEFKGKRSKYNKKKNAEQLKMQQQIFLASHTAFVRIIQGNKRGEIKLEIYKDRDTESSRLILYQLKFALGMGE